jgi:hypothetical protein
MLEVLINPNAFFAARMKEAERLRVPLLIVLLSGLISGIGAYIMAGVTIEMLREVLPQEALGIATTVGGISAFVSAIIMTLLMWVVFAAIFFGISWLFKGAGTFKRTLEVIGYGYLPMIFSGIIGAALIYQFVSTAQIPQVTDPNEMVEIVTRWIAANPMIRLSSILGMLFMLWSANIWVFGLKHARNLTTRNAVITVAIPVLAYLAYSVWQLGALW